MTVDQSAIAKSLPDHLFERMRALNRLPATKGGEFVLFWMHHAVRDHENPALDTAIAVAKQLNLPVLVYQGLSGRHIYNSDRHHTFIMEGARGVQKDLNRRGIVHCFYLAEEPDAPSPIRKLVARSALTVTEDFPVPPLAGWSRRLAEAAPVAFWAVDSACILPMQALKKAYARAYQFRNDNWGEYEQRISRPYEESTTEAQVFRGPLGFEPVDLASADIAALCARCRIDHTVGPVPHTQGGSSAGYQRWELFKRRGLPDYARKRNDAAVQFPVGVSRMSAYLHHGHVSPFRIARETASSGARGADKFLDELLIWRELAHNFCFHNDQPDVLNALPGWARKTLVDHREDPRPAVYAWDQLARGATGDALWDAAQRSLLIHGELHNNVRMTWGKAILQWTRSPQAALKMMIDLNHRYALDGNDPNSYGGILWCLGLFDRPFTPAKSIIGTVRPRSTRSHAARLDLQAYAARVFRPAASPPLRVAVVGAGLSGLMAARTLADHGHRVQVFEKTSESGGRISTQQIDSCAFDDGAQYFTVRDERFRRYVDSWMEIGLVGAWEGRIRVVAGGAVRNEAKRHRRLVGIPSMSAIACYMANGLDVQYRSRVSRVYREKSSNILLDDNANSLGDYDVLIVATPPAPGAAILEGCTPLVERLRSVRMAPCWAVMLAFKGPLDLPFDGAFFDDSTIVWAARNSSKPGREPGECWVLHANSDWSATHFDDTPEEAARRLSASFSSAVGIRSVEPVRVAARRWRFAKAEHPLDDGCLWDLQAMIGVCGDWCSNSRVEGAFLSGAAAAGRVLGIAGNRIEAEGLSTDASNAP